MDDLILSLINPITVSENTDVSESNIDFKFENELDISGSLLEINECMELLFYCLLVATQWSCPLKF